MSDVYKETLPPRLRDCHVVVCVGGMVAALFLGMLLGIGIGYFAIATYGKAINIATSLTINCILGLYVISL